MFCVYHHHYTGADHLFRSSYTGADQFSRLSSTFEAENNGESCEYKYSSPRIAGNRAKKMEIKAGASVLIKS